MLQILGKCLKSGDTFLCCQGFASTLFMSLVLLSYLRMEESEKEKKCWQLLSIYVVRAEDFGHGSCNLMWSNLYLLSKVLKVNFLTDVNGTHLQGLLLGNSIFEEDIRVFFDYYCGENSQQSLVQYRAEEGDSTAVLHRGSTCIWQKMCWWPGCLYYFQ